MQPNFSYISFNLIWSSPNFLVLLSLYNFYFFKSCPLSGFNVDAPGYNMRVAYPGDTQGGVAISNGNHL